MPRKSDKRERLVNAADELIFQQTFNSTTLADIAKRADVPLGNVYYYFKTKEDILKAVVDKRTADIQARFKEWEELPDVKSRIRAFIDHSASDLDTTARFGCTLGSLCQELGKHSSQLSELASKQMKDTIVWVEKQFSALGKGEKSRSLSEYLISAIQGVSLLTLTFKDPSYLKNQTKELESWLETA